MISGHLEIADGTSISAGTFVFDSIDSPGVYTGTFPVLPHREWQHVAAVTRRLRSIVQRLRRLERAGDNEES
jgi:UDP-3-O-[3-hydroxymyristoyl] glucosamine N-acyltransferase